MRRTRVVYIFPISHRFRAPFHERLKEILSSNNIDYGYFYTTLDPEMKRDTVDIPWAMQTSFIKLSVAGKRLIYQAVFLRSLKPDLVILHQENGLLVNYPIQIVRRLLGRKVAFFGHGKNFQAGDSESVAERFKRFWITRVDWWFAYTARSADILLKAGVPQKRITIVNNAIDTSAISVQLENISEQEREKIRREKFCNSKNIGLYIGGLYPLKRIPFLLEAATLVRLKVPDFQLIIVGGGDDQQVKAFAQQHAWAHYMGPQFDFQKTLLASLAKVFLMPGLVGLAVLDSFAYGLPMVTTNVNYHSPEIEYLKHEQNGVIVQNSNSLEDYADAVVRVLEDEEWRIQLTREGARNLKMYSIEAMSDRFAAGVLQVLRDV